MVSAVCAIVLIVGVAWLGNGKPVSVALPNSVKPSPDPTFALPPEDPPVMEESAEPQEASPPVLEDIPRNAPPDVFTQPVEPHVPAPDVDHTLVTVPSAIAHPGAERTFTLDQLDEQPAAQFQARPDYPTAMRQSGLTGDVLVDFIVDSKGRVRNVRAMRSSRPEFEEAACRAVAKWKFKPGRKGGLPVATHMQVPIVFSLDGGQ
jgi:protein TonB